MKVIRSGFNGPSYDRELESLLSVHPESRVPQFTSDFVATLRETDAFSVPLVELLAGRDIEHSGYIVDGEGDRPSLEISLFSPRNVKSDSVPCYFYIHGGGMVIGDRYAGIQQFLGWVERFGIAMATVEYRLAPEHADPTPIEDCYAGLLWIAAQSSRLGLDRSRLIVGGASAGGGLAAGVALLARDRAGPPLLGQMLICPMIDDRNTSVSSQQYSGIGMWDRESNQFGWRALLGGRAGRADVSCYAAPARATNLQNLPPAFIEVGSAEVFRDEAVSYASAIWAASGDADLHVWAGAFHGFDFAFPTSKLAFAALSVRETWMQRILRDGYSPISEL